MTVIQMISSCNVHLTLLAPRDHALEISVIQMILCLIGEPIDIQATESDSTTTKVSPQVLTCAARADSECIWVQLEAIRAFLEDALGMDLFIEAYSDAVSQLVTAHVNSLSHLLTNCDCDRMTARIWRVVPLVY